MDRKKLFPWPFSKRKMKCACTFSSLAAATFQSPRSYRAHALSSIAKSSLTKLDMEWKYHQVPRRQFRTSSHILITWTDHGNPVEMIKLSRMSADAEGGAATKKNILDCFVFCLFPNSDVDECYTRTHNCDELARCTNTEGSFQCLCRSGYSGMGTVSNCYGKWAILIGCGHVLAGNSLAIHNSLVIIFNNRTCCSPWPAKRFLSIFLSDLIVNAEMPGVIFSPTYGEDFTRN